MPETIEFAYPCNPTARITQPFGARPEYYSQFFVVDWDGVKKPLPGHEGQDFGLPIGSDIYSCLAGQVTDSYTAGNYGTQVRVVSGDFRIVYAHLSESLVRVGDIVSKGQLIARSGNSGNSSGPHVHVTVKLAGASQAGITNFPGDIVNPALYIKLPMPPDPPVNGVKAYITAIPYLNVRSGKTTAAPILGTVPYDAAVTLLEPTIGVPLIGVAGEWIKVLTDKGLIGYCAAGYLRLAEVVAVTRAIGFDFAQYQPTIVSEQTWKSIGAAFLIVRASATYQNTPGMKLDPLYNQHIASARSAGVLVGAYHYLTHQVSMIEQARFFINAAGLDLDLPYWADVEFPGVTAGQVREFCEEVDRLTGGVCGIYTRKNLFQDSIGHNLAWAGERPLWVAQYPFVYKPGDNPSGVPDSWAAGDWDIWQYSSFDPSWYPGRVDHNVYKGTNEEIWAKYGIKEPTLTERIASLESRVGALEAKFNIV